MDKRYEIFCLADPYFYETPDRLSDSASRHAPPRTTREDGPTSRPPTVPLIRAHSR